MLTVPPGLREEDRGPLITAETIYAFS